MYFSAKRADWLRENGNCSDVEHFKAIQEVFDWMMGHIFEAASSRRDTEVELYCPDKYSIEIEDKLKSLGYEVEYIGDGERLKIEW